MLLAVRLVKVDWCVSIRLLLVKVSFQSIVCLFGVVNQSFVRSR